MFLPFWSANWRRGSGKIWGKPDAGPVSYTLVSAGDYNTSSIGSGAEAYAAILRSAGVQGPTAGVANQPMTFTLTASDAFQTDPNSQFTFTVDWGDEPQPQTYTGTSGTPASHTYAASGSYSVFVSWTDQANRTSNSASQTITISPSPLTASNLQSVLPQSPSTPNALTFQVSPSTMPAAVIQAVNGLTNVSQPVTIALDLGGGTYSTDGVVANPPPNVTFVVKNGTLDPSYPALTVEGGQVSVLHCTLTTTGDVTNHPRDRRPLDASQRCDSGIDKLH